MKELDLSHPDRARPAPQATSDECLGSRVVLKRKDVPTRPPRVSLRLTQAVPHGSGHSTARFDGSLECVNQKEHQVGRPLEGRQSPSASRLGKSCSGVCSARSGCGGQGKSSSRRRADGQNADRIPPFEVR
jgi:hypothetical protein